MRSDLYRRNVGKISNLLPCFERGPDGCLRVDLGWEIFQIGLTDLETASSSTKVFCVDLKGSGHLFEETHLAFEDWGRTSHTFSCQEGRKDTVSAGICKGTPLPHRELSSSNLAHCDVRVQCHVHCLSHLFMVEIHESPGGKGCGNEAIADMIPSSVT